MYSIKMRSSAVIENKSKHISGAEKIVNEKDLESNLSILVRRALTHTRGKADFISIKVEKIEDNIIKRIDALPVYEIKANDTEEARKYINKILHFIGVFNTQMVWKSMRESYELRGATLLGIKTGTKLEKDRTRGIRATYLDSEVPIAAPKDHFAEAIVLASKVAYAPGIIGEICISDDPECTTGYFASYKLGYVRVYNMKNLGDLNGGRVFLHNEKCKVEETIEFIENEKVLVRNICNSNNPFVI
ncbi:6-carboxyhexanoate--CoA ligase [Luxibacter massiliensis]|uniref:6-carboxyhexanoate--CoA ligase n=1 Tax=Luxibacter massiliensis TaxID=2219695 RepID=UPI000F0528A1|nr:6-carboxyhexanoate--CoA ligase [Luxibacter massiliensis]